MPISRIPKYLKQAPLFEHENFYMDSFLFLLSIYLTKFLTPPVTFSWIIQGQQNVELCRFNHG